MKLTLLSKRDYSAMTLPEKLAGHYWVRGRNSEGKMHDVVAVEALRSFEPGGTQGWVLKSNRRFKIFGRDGEVPSALLGPLELYKIQGADSCLRYVLYTEPAGEDRKRYRGYELTGGEAELFIGRDPENNICYPNEFVSGSHAKLTITGSGASIADLSSSNNTYVNGKAVKEARLDIGDVIYIMGLQLIAAHRLIFVNDPDGKVKVQSENLRRWAPEYAKTGESDDEDYEEAPEDYYYRAPRLVDELKTFELRLDSPPSKQTGDEMPLMMVLGPSITMGMASAASGSFALTNAIGRGDIASATPSLVMSASMLMGTLMWPLITKSFQRRTKKRKEATRQKTYKEYLAKMERLVGEETARQERTLRANDPGGAVYAERILAPIPQIWERTPKHADFLCLRLGCGDLPLRADLQYSERKFTAEPDNLAEDMYSFGERERRLKNVPICLPLVERFVCGIYGNREFLVPYAKSLILQIAALHSYDEVKLALIYDERDAAEFAFARYLPHTMDNTRTVRFIAANSEETKLLSAALDPIVEHRKALVGGRLEDESPYYVVICLDRELAAKTQCVRRIQEHKGNLRFSVLSVFERLKDLPKECSAAAELGENRGGRLTFIGNAAELPVNFTADAPGGDAPNLGKIVKALANTEVDTSGSNFRLPKKYTFFEMLGIGMVEHLNLAENWATNDPTKSLAASVGIDRYGEDFRLDLHERSHGPHGLVAGMTGSGKSEFIIAYILSMAVSFHPHEVSFILIDYKGGGMAKSFENIPHTAGVITNLDGNGIKRSLASMRSELHRRERIFRDISKQHSVSNIDIYKYQKLYREGKVGEPLPHLLLISDEFAELKKEQPDFMTELTSTARVGRSLGVHLILATQKPGGVVDDQIRSNSRFRICLKVQDNGDSTEMLGRTEAAALVDTGRFYLQVGNNELFELGQSAWAGAPYYPSAKPIKDRDDAVAVVNHGGRIIAEANTDRFAAIKDPPKQLDVVTGHIARYCEEENIKGRRMWLEPVPGRVYLESLEQKYQVETESFELEPVVGEFDDPAHQKQGVLRLPLTKEGNAIIYGSAGNGKEMFVEAVCYGLIKNHPPGEVNIYIMDFGAEILTAFAAAPHVGDVILSHESEKVNNLFKLMIGKLETRKKLLSQFGGDMVQYNKQAQRGEPALVVIVNNYAAFTELFDDRAPEVNYLTREGPKYGIYFILACTGVNNVKFSMLQNFKSIYCLQLNNPDDYPSAVGKTEGMTPEKHKGRGLWRLDKDSLLEFQTARVAEAEPQYNFIRGFCEKAAKAYAGAKAAGIPVLPEKVTAQFLAGHIQPQDFARVPIGVEKETLEISRFNFAASTVTLVISTGQEWQEFTEALAELLAGRYGAKTIVLSPAGKTQKCPDGENLRVYGDAGGCAGAVYEIFSLVLSRNNEYKDALAAGEKPPDYEPVFVVIQSMALLKTVLERQTPENGEKKEGADDNPLIRLKLAMEKCAVSYKVYFVVAESLNSLNASSAEGWYKAHVTGSSGIWVGSGASSQYRLTINKKPANFSAELEAGFGFAVQNATAVLVKLLQ